MTNDELINFMIQSISQLQKAAKQTKTRGKKELTKAKQFSDNDVDADGHSASLLQEDYAYSILDVSSELNDLVRNLQRLQTSIDKSLTYEEKLSKLRQG